MTAPFRPRVSVWNCARMVTLQADVVPVPEGDPVLLYGIADGIQHGMAVVKLDDGRELLIASRDLTVLP